VDYTRRLYANILAWYDSADRKAQIILTANGGFVTVLTGLGLTRPDEVTKTVAVFGPETWLLFALSAVGLVISFGSAALCLWSRLLSRTDSEKILRAHHVRPDDATTYDPAVLWFFQLVEHLDESALEQRLRAFSPEDEIDALSDQIVQLARRVTRKHRWVNIGFIATATSLSCLLGTAVSYFVRAGA
jgi:hypothetical protein